eukprot:377794-Pyramimonas_sp.AAC.1
MAAGAAAAPAAIDLSALAPAAAADEIASPRPRATAPPAPPSARGQASHRLPGRGVGVSTGIIA